MVRSRRSWAAAALALLTLVVCVLVLRGAGGAGIGRHALTPGVELDASVPGLVSRAAELHSGVAASVAATATVEPVPEVARRARAAAKAPPEATIVVGFVVSEAAHPRPLNAHRASVSFEVARGDERWTGRKVDTGLWFEARRAFGHERLDSSSGADKFLYVELDPATPHGVPLAFKVELTFNNESEVLEARHRGTFRGEGTLTLTGARYQWLTEVQCHPIGAWAEGMVLAGPHIDLEGAHVDVIELVSHEGSTAALGGEVLVEATHAADSAVAHGPVLADGTFSVPGPSRPTLPHMRLQVVLANGRVYTTQPSFEAFKGGIVLRLEATRTAIGRLLFRGASAAGLARIHAEQGGAHIGQVVLERDGTFTLSGAPYSNFDLVIESGRPGGELARLPLASLTGDLGGSKLDLGVIEVAGHAEVMELELVDRTGAPAGAQLHWRGRGGSGSVALRESDVHTLLLTPVVPYDMELVASPGKDPIPLAAARGRVRVVVGE
jgi:hypothetical protein